ncbi:uncharacterized protein LOC129945211 [Eupeodes corollae]|uniref:uncharacterized protein LOC129945211 n=1 Tax=Eupeodes corollae TaxID=290404 RepID=UPI0024901604|nr:uncharacterized protein LOC129945211 [Eupeodes corollae]
MFTEELEEYESKGATRKSLLSLDAYIDGNGILRVGGRLQNTLLPYNQQHPIILKPNYYFSELVMRDAHNKTLPGGNQQSTQLWQLIGSLPEPQVRISRPFTHTGIDYAGPIEIKALKAIHLETVSDMTAQSFLEAFRGFTARRGLCAQIYSDCVTNFVGAN